MPDEETLQLIADGELDPSDYEDFEALDDEVKELVKDGEITVEEAIEMG